MVLPNYQVIEASDGRYEWPSVTREDIARINAAGGRRAGGDPGGNLAGRLRALLRAAPAKWRSSVRCTTICG